MRYAAPISYFAERLARIIWDHPGGSSANSYMSQTESISSRREPPNGSKCEKGAP